MTDELTPDETKEILEALNSALDKGPWKKSIFLRSIGKKLEGIREEFKSGLIDEVDFLANADLAKQTKTNKAIDKVYISLYNAEGKNIEKWATIIGALLLQNLSRPTYQREEDVKNAIKIKGGKNTDGYVVIEVADKDIVKLPEKKAPKDRQGILLLTLKQGAIKPENIKTFHHDGESYVFDDGKLTKQ